MQNIEGKKRARQEDTDSDYLFDNFLQFLPFVQALPLANYPSPDVDADEFFGQYIGHLWVYPYATVTTTIIPTPNDWERDAWLGPGI